MDLDEVWYRLYAKDCSPQFPTIDNTNMAEE
jgi:hypothetical protein